LLLECIIVPIWVVSPTSIVIRLNLELEITIINSNTLAVFSSDLIIKLDILVICLHTVWILLHSIIKVEPNSSWVEAESTWFDAKFLVIFGEHTLCRIDCSILYVQQVSFHGL
jgi:hypothetical protein